MQHQVMKRVTLATTAIMLAALLVGAPHAASAPAFATRLAATEQPLKVTGTTLAGRGEAVLSNAIEASRYVLIGEDHLSREIPRFTTAICRMMAPQGLHALAVEIGPEAARVVNSNLRRPDRVERLSRYMLAHPDAMAFQNGRDESEMATACAQTAGPDFAVWGLDQEFFGAAGSLLDAMLAEKPGPLATAAIREMAVQDRAATATALTTGSPDKLMIYAATDAQIGKARNTIQRDGGPRVKQLFDALVETRAIFLASASGEGDPTDSAHAF